MKRLNTVTINSSNTKVDHMRSTITVIVLKYMTLAKLFKFCGSVVSSATMTASNTFLIQLYKVNKLADR